MVKLDICGSIPAYTKNLLVSWSDYKDLSLEVDSINWNSLKKNIQFEIVIHQALQLLKFIVIK